MAKPTKRDLQSLEKKLLAERDELARELTEFERQARRSADSAQKETALDEDYADLGTSTFERERDLSLQQNLQDLVDQVERALERIQEGTYGTCESCGKGIEVARLRALPYASLCIECKRREEASR